ncbi:regulator [Mycobacterium holsaticum DSM 44478]|nr:regulator [Mycolicibacterium holsaticum DSM 44478 = JCM 12374]
MTTLQQVELGVLGPLQVRQYGLPVTIPGAKPRALLTMLGLHGASVVSADVLLDLLWGDEPPRTAGKALQTHISALRRALGDGFIVTEGTGWTLRTTEIDATRYKLAISKGRDAVAAGDTSHAVACFDEALTLWRGVPELPDGTRGVSEKTRWFEGHAALVEDRADAVLATGRAAEIIGELEAAVAEGPLRERRWGQLMLALYRAGRQGEALGAFQRARSLLADELGVDPGPDLRRLETAIVAQDSALEVPVSPQLSVVTRAVTFLLTDIEGSTAAWEADAEAMAVALARHDEIVEQIVTLRGGRLVKTRGEGDATFSVFDRPSTAAMAAIDLQEAIRHEPWDLAQPMRIRVALHTGEVELRDGDYFGRAVNRAARLRSLAAGGQILCSGATAELVIDSLPDDVVLADLGTRQLRNLARPEHVFELRLLSADESPDAPTEEPFERPVLPAVLAVPGPFVGRGDELGRLLAAWQTALAVGTRAVLIAGEPGVGKTRLAGEWSRQAYEQGAVVLYGRCDEDLGAHYQPFAEALRALVPHVGASRLRGLRGVESLLPLVPRLTDVLPDLCAPHHGDPDTERYALFDAVVALLEIASADAPVILVLDDLHWAAKPTLLLMRHLLRFGERARVQIVGTYRSTDLDRSHPLAAMLADLHRDGFADRIALGGLDEEEVSAYVVKAGYDDEELAQALAAVTSGNPFFLIEALQHVDESGGHWDPNTLPQGVREAVSRRLSRLPAETNKALAAAAVVGSRFALDLVERVMDQDLVDAFDEAGKAGIVIEEQGGRYRFNHALVRQSLLAELPSVRRMRLHQHIAATLEAESGADEELLAELAHHYFECAWAGNAAKAVHYCRRAADQAMTRLAYEGAADHYDRALHALDELDDELPDRDELQAELLIARCEALLAAGDVVSAKGAVSQLQDAAGDSDRLAAWGTSFDGQLSMLTDPERLDDIESAVAAAAATLAGLDDAAGVANAHTVRAGCLARLGRIADCETALDQALTAARRAQEHRRVNTVLAGAPLAALWGPNPVPRAGGRCLDVVRLLRITTGSPVVEATSTRCQGVLDAFRGRAAAGRQLIDSARRTLTDLGMRHALLEVDQFAGIVELIADDPAAAEPHLRRAYDGFRRMRLEADTAESAALLARACLALGRDGDADELCAESERLAGHALKASIAWRTVRAQLLARNGAHDEARRVAEEAVAAAERTDALVDHGDACLALATVLSAAGDTVEARAAAERAVRLYELKGAVALADKTRSILGERELPVAESTPGAPPDELDNACVRALRRLDTAFDREAWDELEDQVATWVTVESRRKVVGVTHEELPSDEWVRGARSYPAIGAVRHSHVVLAVRGDRLALTRLEIGTADLSPGAPRDELLQLYGLDDNGQIALQVWFDTGDMDAAIAELEATHARFEEQQHPRPENSTSRADDRLIEQFSQDTRVDDRRRGLRRESADRASAVANTRRPRIENAASRAHDRFNTAYTGGDWDALAEIMADGFLADDRRRLVGGGVLQGLDSVIAQAQITADLGITNSTTAVVATRGERLALMRARYWGDDLRPDAFEAEVLHMLEIDTQHRITNFLAFDSNDLETAIAELDVRYACGEASRHNRTWSVIAKAYAGFNRRDLIATAPRWESVDHRRGAAFAPGDMIAYVEAAWADSPDTKIYVAAVHRLSDVGAVVTHVAQGLSREGFNAEWQDVHLLTVEGETLSRCELFDDADLDAALTKFYELTSAAPRLENAATRTWQKVIDAFNRRDLSELLTLTTADGKLIDRRKGLSAVHEGAERASAARALFVVPESWRTEVEPVALRGSRLALIHQTYRDTAVPDQPIAVDILTIAEVDDALIGDVVNFDPDDLDAAYEELDARYLAGEAATHAHTWSAIVTANATFNRRETPPTTPDWVNVDHRRGGTAFAPGDQTAYMRATWGVAPHISNRIVAVHRLNNLGAAFTQVVQGTSREGFSAEWRDVVVMNVDDDQISLCEVFDENDLGAALTRFDELSRPALRLENGATRARESVTEAYNRRDVQSLLAGADSHYEDRRKGLRDEGRPDRSYVHALLSETPASWRMQMEPVAIRGDRLALTREIFRDTGEAHQPIAIELMTLAELDHDNLFSRTVFFDSDDINGAFGELTARWIASGDVAQPEIIEAAHELFAVANRHDWDALALLEADAAHVNHRQLSFGDDTIVDHWSSLRMMASLIPDLRVELAEVLTHSAIGLVTKIAVRGTTPEGSAIELPAITLLLFDGPRVTRMETFDVDQQDVALARFTELNEPN